MPYIGKTECHQCGREVDAHVNVSGMGYYNCGPCGFRAIQKTQRGNRQFLDRVRRDPPPEETPEAEPEKSEISRDSQTVKQEQPEPKKAGGLLQNSIFGGRR